MARQLTQGGARALEGAGAVAAGGDPLGRAPHAEVEVLLDQLADDRSPSPGRPVCSLIPGYEFFWISLASLHISPEVSLITFGFSQSLVRCSSFISGCGQRCRASAWIK